jgi:uncharacterized protein YneF (UPF0154 family)
MVESLIQFTIIVIAVATAFGWWFSEIRKMAEEEMKDLPPIDSKSGFDASRQHEDNDD